MSQTAAESPPTESAVPLFDVMVRIPSGARLEDIERRAKEDAGLPEDRVEKLINVLRSVPEAKIGSGVPRERADKAKEQFTKAGLHVEIIPQLSLQALVTGTFDNRFVCPACNTRVVLPENRQCPNCGVFVDKVTDEFLLKRKIMEQERARLEFQTAKDAKLSEQRTKQSVEAAIRDRIRKELEEEYGLRSKPGLFAGRAGLVRAVTGLVLLGGAFLVGTATSQGGLPWSKKSQAATAAAGNPASVDKMLDSMGPPAGSTEAAAAAGGNSAGTASGDPDINDPLIQAAGGKRIGAKGLSIEEAVGAAQVLAKSVGNTTAERALNGSGAPGQRTGGAGASGPEAAAAAAPAAVPKQAKLTLAADFAVQLAELGQVPRAREVVKSLLARPDLAAEPGAAAAARAAQVEVQAWSMQSLPSGQARQAAESLKGNIAALPDAAERARASIRAGVVLSRLPNMPAAASRVFFTLAGEELKAVSDAGQRATLAGLMAVGMGEALLAEAREHARTGFWNRAQATAAQADAIVAQAPDAYSQARLFAMQYQLRKLLGQPEAAVQSLDGAISLAARNKSPADHAAWLRHIAQLSQTASHERMTAALAALQAQVDSANGMERAQALVHLSLLFADAGLGQRSEQYRNAALAVPGLSPADAAGLQAGLIVQNELAMARALHASGLYAESEAILQRVGSYVL